MRKRLYAALLTASLVLGWVSPGFSQGATAPSGAGTSARRLGRHQRHERKRLHRHERRERRRAAEGGLTEEERERLRQHQKLERERLREHEKEEREKLREMRKENNPGQTQGQNEGPSQ